MVKQKFADFARGCICPPEFPVCVCGKKPRGTLVSRKPITPTEKELEQNPFLGTDLGNYLRKIRLSVTSKGKGKRGGARVITYTLTLQEDYVEITLLTIYDKSDTANIPTPELLRIAKECGL